MVLCIFNPEHDLCLANGRAHYVPPHSAIDFARRDAGIMRTLYPGSHCCSAYDLPSLASTSQKYPFHAGLEPVTEVVAWGWNVVLKQALLKHGIEERLLPTDDAIDTIRELQHRSTVLPLQPDCHAVFSVEEMDGLLTEGGNWVMKAPWSGAGRGLHWVCGCLTPHDKDWMAKTIASQRCIIAEPRRAVVANVALEYRDCLFIGYSYFTTGSGVYKENIYWTDERIENTFPLLPVRERIEYWLEANIWPRYQGPLGVDLMVCADGEVHVAEINFRHTMGMVAHEKIIQGDNCRVDI